MSRLKKVKRRVWRLEDARLRRKTDYVTGEEPLQIQLRAGAVQKTIAITMRTPGQDYELVAGFLYNEGVIRDKHDIVQMTYCVGDDGRTQEYNSLDVQLRGAQLPDLPSLDRHFLTSSACGLCGALLLDDLQQRKLPSLPDGPFVAPAVLCGLPDTLRDAQRLFASTGGLHAAALFDADGRLRQTREDVGRHNALDKLIGWALLNRQLPFQEQIILVSGRASYELLQKCRIAGAPIFCAISAPSSLAVQLAEQFDSTDLSMNGRPVISSQCEYPCEDVTDHWSLITGH